MHISYNMLSLKLCVCAGTTCVRVHILCVNYLNYD